MTAFKLRKCKVCKTPSPTLSNSLDFPKDPEKRGVCLKCRKVKTQLTMAIASVANQGYKMIPTFGTGFIPDNQLECEHPA